MLKWLRNPWGLPEPDGIQDAFRFLVESDRYRLLGACGNAIGGQVTYASPTLRLEVVWDRGDPWLWFSQPGSRVRYDWELVEHVLRGARRYEGVAVPVKSAPIRELAAFLRRHLPEIEARFSGPQREGTLQWLEALRREELATQVRWMQRLGRRRPTPSDT